jgi:hypothetical protein
VSTYRDAERAQRDAEAARAAKADLLGRVRVASPCNASWDDMHGDDRVRLCLHCDKHVHDLSAMTLTEAEDFVERAAEEAGFVCVRFYRRADGTILTADCPTGKARKLRRLKVIGAAAGALAAVAGMRASPDGASPASDTAGMKVSAGGLVVDPAHAPRSDVYK